MDKFRFGLMIGDGLMKRGIEKDAVLPKALTEKLIPICRNGKRLI
jgi:hypothetical protein